MNLTPQAELRRMTDMRLRAFIAKHADIDDMAQALDVSRECLKRELARRKMTLKSVLDWVEE
jgi:hypothetical protein